MLTTEAGCRPTYTPDSSRFRFFGGSSPPRSSAHSRLRLDRTALGAWGAGGQGRDASTPRHLGPVPPTGPVVAAKRPRPLPPCRLCFFLDKAVFLCQAPQHMHGCWVAQGGQASAEPPTPLPARHLLPRQGLCSLTGEGQPKAQEPGLCGQLDHYVTELWPQSSHLENADGNYCGSLQSWGGATWVPDLALGECQGQLPQS